MATAADYVQVAQQIYVAYFGRPADLFGLDNMTKMLAASGAPTDIAGFKAAYGSNATVKSIIDNFGSSAESKALYTGTDTAFVTAIYQNILNRDPDVPGLAFWVQAIENKTISRAEAATQILAAAVKVGGNAPDAAIVNNKVAVATNFTKAIDTAAEINGYSGDAAAAQARDMLHNVNGSTKPAEYQATVDATLAAISTGAGASAVLTNGTDVLTANIFNAGLVYTPAGNNRINSLQSEDVLTGKDITANANNTLNATLGNANDNGLQSVTPTLKNIQSINLDITGNTNTLDVRFADSLKSLAINKLTLEASNAVNIENIGQPAANLAVRNSAAVDGTVNFNYIKGVLAAKNAPGTAAGGDIGNVTVENVALAKLHVGSNDSTEGFETVNLKSTGTNAIKNLELVDAETVVITGSGELKLLNNTNNAEFVGVGVGGITIGDGIGIRSIDATAFTGNLNLNVTAAVGQHNDPGNSGAVFYTNIKLGSGNDTLWTTKTISADLITKLGADTIDGGAGKDTLRTFSAGVDKGAKITNVEALELRGAGSTAYISAFDANLASVLVRNEAGGAQTFKLNETTKALAEGGNIVLRHGISVANADVVQVNLADATAASDTVVLTVQNDLNNGTTYDYTLTAQSQLSVDFAAGTATATAAQLKAAVVENVTVNDNDTESNVLTLTNAADHTGKVTLTGGTAGLKYTVNSTLVAKTVDASAQLSNLNLMVGVADQTIKLGSGDDVLTFDGLDTFNGADVLTDVGGTDTVRAAFSKDVSGTPDLSGIEKLHIVATANTTLDLTKGQGITELALLSGQAVNQDGEVFSKGIAGAANTAASVDTSDVITLKNTKLSAINFFGDADGTGTAAAPFSSSATQTFNGLTLENNIGDTVAVNIAAPLEQGDDSKIGGLVNGLKGFANGITNYNLGQLTTHGVKDLSITVANEHIVAATGKSDATTTIANIWDRDLVNLKLTAKGNLNVNTVTGNTVNSNMKSFDASAVQGNLTAVVKALGDNAVVTLGGGDDSFNALGSAGNNVVINGGNGKNNIVGTAQSDYITTGTGNDIIDAGRGNNTVKSGAGNDIISALNGSNTIDVGSGWADQVTLNYDTDAQRGLTTSVIAGSGTNASVTFTGGTTVSYGFAVGDGAELSIKFTGATFDANASTLNGRSANAPLEANLSNLIVATVAPAVNTAVTGGSAADVFLDLSSGAGNNYTVSTGAGNDAIVISQTSTAIHTINGGTGADRIILSAAAGADRLVTIEGDSTAAARDIVTNFHLGEDVLVLSGTLAPGSTANLTNTVFTAAAGAVAATNMLVSGTGVVTFDNSKVIGKDISVDQVLNFLAANAKVNGDVYSFSYDSNGNGAIDAADNTIVFQNQGTDIVIELVGSATNDVRGFTTASVANV